MDSKRRWTLFLLSTASFVAVVDTTIVSVALPSIRQSLGYSTGGSQWVLNAYALVFGGLLLLFGRMGDLYGRRRLFVLGLAVFGTGSVLAGLAWGEVALLAGRSLQGAGAAAFVPASLSMVTAAFPEAHERSRALGIYGGMAALGFVVGMVGGGVITEFWGWRWVFLVNVPVAALMLLASGTLRETRDPAAAKQLDVAGAVVVTGGLVMVIYAMTSVPAQGLSTLTVVAAAGGLGLLLSFLLVERRHPAPLVPLRAVARPSVLVPNGAIALQSMVGIAWLYVLTLYFQDVLGHGPLRTGLLFAPMTFAAVLAAPAAGRVTSRLGPRTTALTGLSMVGCGIATMVGGMTATGSLPLVVAGMVVGESGFMFSNVALTVAGTSSLEDDRAGLAAGLLNTFIQLGSGVGLGIAAVVIAAQLPSGSAESSATALRGGLVACLCFVAVALALVGRGLRARDAEPVQRDKRSR
jgi:EmrB/QacA subfamily drug resistance transporter